MISEVKWPPQNLLVGPNTLCQSTQVAIIGGTALAVTALTITCLASYIRVPCEDRDIQDRVARPWITCCSSTAGIGIAIALVGLAVRLYLPHCHV